MSKFKKIVNLIKIFSSFILVLATVSCAKLNQKKLEQINQAQPTPKLAIPKGFDKAAMKDYYPIPNLSKHSATTADLQPSLEPPV